MKKELLMESTFGQNRLALVEDGLLSELYIERPGTGKLVGNIYLGRVMNVLPGMQAAFVDIGLDKNGFLYAGDVQIDRRSIQGDDRALEQALLVDPIKKLLKPGQEVLVQVTKVPGGSKGPRLTGNITLPGRLVVLLPTLHYVGVSRRIESEAQRDQLREMAERLKPEGMGVIVRTAAGSAEEKDIAADIDYLVKLWSSISTGARYAKAPSLIHSDLSLSHRAVRDMLQSDVDAFLIQGASAYREASEHAKMLPDEFSRKVALYEGDTPLFDSRGVDHQLEKALARKVWLKSGGYLIFDYTEALTVIDVNTGKFVGKRSLDDTVFLINSEAAVEIARQLRLRDIGGIIVIDFIDMDDEANRESLLSLFAQELKKDRTKTNLVGLTGLGLVEMTRKKVRGPLHATLNATCDHCHGSGMVPSDETVARAALRELSASAKGGGAWLIEASPGVAGQILLIAGAIASPAFVVADGARKHGSYAISAVLQHELPRGAKPITPHTTGGTSS